MVLSSRIARNQRAFYAGLLRKWGRSVDAVASGDAIYKAERYRRLTQSLGISRNDSIHEVGFGLGHFFDYLHSSYGITAQNYTGSEVTGEYLDALKETSLCERVFLHDITTKPLPTPADWVIFPGTFYHLAGTNPLQMRRAIEAGLRNGFASCNKGIAVNFVTSQVDYRKNGLMYVDPARIMNFAFRNLSRFVIVDHASPLFEFSLIVFRKDWLKNRYPQAEFRRYF